MSNSTKKSPSRSKTAQSTSTTPVRTPAERCKEINADIIDKLESTIGFIDFWKRAYEIEKMKSEISDILLFSKITPLINQREQIASEVMVLAKRRHNQLLGTPEA